jgi:hypothetical protein
MLGMKLGVNLIQIRVYGSYFEHRDSSEALGVNFEVKKIDVRGLSYIPHSRLTSCSWLFVPCMS